MVDRAHVCVIHEIDIGRVLGNDVVDIDLFTRLERLARFQGHGLLQVLSEFSEVHPTRSSRPRLAPSGIFVALCVESHGFGTRGRSRNASSVARLSFFRFGPRSVLLLLCASRVAILFVVRLFARDTCRLKLIFHVLVLVMFPDDPTLRTFSFV